jgi:hypothetical protein
MYGEGKLKDRKIKKSLIKKFSKGGVNGKLEKSMSLNHNSGKDFMKIESFKDINGNNVLIEE